MSLSHIIINVKQLGETGASCYGGRLLQGHFMQNYYIDGEIADSSFTLIFSVSRYALLSGRACYSFNEDRTPDLRLIFIAFDIQRKTL